MQRHVSITFPRISRSVALLTSHKKAEAASAKSAVDNAKKAVVEDEEWSKGAKSNAKKSVPDFVLLCHIKISQI